jgi:hypothetical protein
MTSYKYRDDLAHCSLIREKTDRIYVPHVVMYVPVAARFNSTCCM